MWLIAASVLRLDFANTPRIKFSEVLLELLFDQNQPLVVVAEDGAEGRLVEDFSEPPKELPGMWRRIWNI
jgi:hypothetical protein